MARILLFPFSFLFGVITFVRNKLYDWNCFSSVQYDDIYVISIGNITVGGTGKTPFVEYLVHLLSKKYRVAVLSRGYKRTTKGFRFVDHHFPPAETGEEPYQIKRKFPNLVVAVDADRIRGIAEIRKVYPDTQVILLDDAFQYRKIKPNYSILLADYFRPLYRNSMLPGGRLREWAFFAKRADVMVVTKSPAELLPGEQRNIRQEYIRIFPHEILFSSIGYGEPVAVFPNEKSLTTVELQQSDVLLITGIAHPKPFETYMLHHATSLQTITFPDHHAFSEKDFIQINEKWKAISSSKKILLTTEKDAVRLQQMKMPETIASCSYYIPIEVKFCSSNEKNENEPLFFDERFKIGDECK